MKGIKYFAFLTILVTILVIYAFDGEAIKHNIQCELVETLQVEDRTIHIIEVGEHHYSIAVWGDDFELTAAEHAEDCPCTN